MSTLAPAPLLATRLRLQQACPYWRALGIEMLEWGAGRSVTRMAPHPRIAASHADGRIDPLALVGLVDDAFSLSFASLTGIDAGMSTLDLRMALARSALPESAVTAESRASMIDDHCGSADVHVRDATGMIVASATASFTFGGYPGGSLPDFGVIGHYDPAAAAGPFCDLIGLSATADGVVVGADNPNVVGWETGKVLHGGVIGATIMAACTDAMERAGEFPAKRLVSLYVRYLRPGSALRSLFGQGWIDRPGRAATHVSAACFHEAGTQVAAGQAVFVTDGDRLRTR